MTAQQLKNSILNLAISGKLVPQDPHDEPASKLVEQIRKEKDKLIKDKKIKPSKFDSVIFKGEDNLHYEKIGRETCCIEDEIPFEIPQNWSWVRLGSLIKIINGVSYNKNDVTHNGIRILRGGNIQNLNLVLKNDDIFLPEKYKDTEKNIRKFDIVLVASTGSKAVIGKPAFVLKDYDSTQIGAFLRIIRPISLDISMYLFIIFSTQYYKNHIQDEVKGTNINNIKSEYINNILIPLPPLSEQKRIVDKLEEILLLVEKYKENKEKLDELNLNFPSKLKKSILDYAIKGKLVEQNLEDESVEILLQKIREEKQRLIKDKKLKADKFLQSTIFIGEDNSPYEKIGKETRCIEDEIPFEIPSSWTWVRLGEISYIVGSKNNQVKAIEIKKYGDFPVVSQSQNLIDGYSSESQKLIKDIPLVMFGDHTRNVKYIDFNFIIGADGTKFHKCIIVEPKFLFYWMKFASEKLKNRGYARHYTLLKSQFIPLPPLPEQKRIVTKIEELLKFLDILQSSL